MGITMVGFLILLMDGQGSQKALRNQLVAFGGADDDDLSRRKLPSNNLRDKDLSSRVSK